MIKKLIKYVQAPAPLLGNLERFLQLNCWYSMLNLACVSILALTG